jgi:hypothetical protein
VPVLLAPAAAKTTNPGLRLAMQLLGGTACPPPTAVMPRGVRRVDYPAGSVPAEGDCGGQRVGRPRPSPCFSPKEPPKGVPLGGKRTSRVPPGCGEAI